MSKYIVALDVGGTSIHAGVVSDNRCILNDNVSVYPSKARESKENVLHHLISVINDQLERIQSVQQLQYVKESLNNPAEVVGIGIAFPGPFDYPNGICCIKGLDKFDSLYGINLKEELRNRLNGNCLYEKLSADCRIVFENDANLFALGEYEADWAKKYTRSICLTLGTGLGSAFLERGELVKGRDGVPEQGAIYDAPFRDSIIDNYLSRRGILQIAAELGFDPGTVDVKELADLARFGHAQAFNIFQRFGKILGEALHPYVMSFKPQAIILGGQIAKSHDLFENDLLGALSGITVDIAAAKNPLFSTFIGIAGLINSGADQG
jgi:glucokinase